MSKNVMDTARDELFAHINRCGVRRASTEQQQAWMDDTIEFMSEEHPELTEEQLTELRAIGLRFCQPVVNARATTPAPGSDLAEVA